MLHTITCIGETHILPTMRDYFTAAQMAMVNNTDYSENTGTLMLYQQKGEMVYSWQAGWQFLRVKHSVIMYLSVWAIKTPTSKLGHECSEKPCSE